MGVVRNPILLLTGICLALAVSAARAECPAGATPTLTADQVNTDYQTYLGRPADAGGSAYWVALSACESAAQIQQGICGSTEALNDIAADYTNFLGRTGAQAEINSWDAQLCASSKSAVDTAICQSTEAQTDIGNYYQMYLGRAAASSEVTFWDTQLCSSTLSNVQQAICGSAEAQNDIAAYIQQVLGRPPQSGEIATYITQNCSSQLSAVKNTICQGSELATGVTNVLQTTLGTIPSATEVSYWAAQACANGIAATTPLIQQLQHGDYLTSNEQAFLMGVDPASLPGYTGGYTNGAGLLANGGGGFNYGTQIVGNGTGNGTGNGAGLFDGTGTFGNGLNGIGTNGGGTGTGNTGGLLKLAQNRHSVTSAASLKRAGITRIESVCSQEYANCNLSCGDNMVCYSQCFKQHQACRTQAGP
jgi:hypothetical protein